MIYDTPQMSKLSNVKGRISYITSHARQENLYAIYRTADNAFWSDLAKECQQEFKRSGADGKCIEARELIIALPEIYTAYEPQQVQRAESAVVKTDGDCVLLIMSDAPQNAETAFKEFTK